MVKSNLVIFKQNISYLLQKKTVACGEKEKVSIDEKCNQNNNNDSSKNYNFTNGTSQLYYAPTEKMEETAYATRQRVYLHNKN
jgi:hypothetical protein